MLMVTMSVLSELLGAHEPGFTNSLREVEISSGSQGADLRLTSDIANKVHSKIRELGLDPIDTTGRELYHGLQGLVKVHDEFLMNALGGEDPENTSDLLHRCVFAINNLEIPKQCWALKHSVAKRLLKDNPPRKVMKQLGYRSIDSMLKRENIEELYVALYFLESQSWLERFIKSYKKLKPSDFEIRSISVLEFSIKNWGQAVTDYVYQNRHNVIALKDMGIIGVLPLPTDQLRGICITMLPLLLHYINEIRVYSSYFKLHQVKPNFDHIVIDTLLHDAKPVAALADQPLHWRVIQRFYGRAGKRSMPQIFEPHIQPEDIEWRQAEEIMYQIEPALKFWESIDYVGALYDGYTVSFNMIDNVLSYCNDLPYGHQASSHLRDSLWDELFVRYIQQDQTEEQVLSQLDNEAPDSQVLHSRQGGLA